MASEISNNEKPVALQDVFQEEELAQLAIDREENIVLIDEQGYTLGEFHTDGYVAEFTYATEASNDGSAELISIADNDGRVQVFTYDEKSGVDKADVYIDGEYLGTKEYSDNTIENENADENIMPLASYVIFYVHHPSGEPTNMSNLITNQQFVSQNSSVTQATIQNFLEKNESPLKNIITVYKRNSDGSVYNTGTSVTPAKVIYDASVNYHVSAKVILVTLQKENSLVTSIIQLY